MTEPKQQSLTPERLAWVESLRQRWNVAGLVVGIVKHATAASLVDKSDGATQTFAQGFGIADSRNEPFTPDSLMCIASNSKLFTSVALGLLIEEGVHLPSGEKVSYETKIKDILLNWELQDRFGTEQADLVDLLCMRTGMPAHDRCMAEMTPLELISKFRDLPASAEFRQARQYSNFNFTTISEIISILAKEPFTEYVKKKIFIPLGMNKTGYEGQLGDDVIEAERFYQKGRDARLAAEAWNEWNAKEHEKEEEGEDVGINRSARTPPAACMGVPTSFGPWRCLNREITAGPGGIFSTVNDMTHWLQELLDPKIIPPSVLERLTTPRILASPNVTHPQEGFTTYGLGIYVNTYRGRRVWTHSGGVPGHHSLVMVLPDEGLAITVFANDETLGWAVHRAVLYTLLDDLLGVDTNVNSNINAISSANNAQEDRVDWEERFMGQAHELEDHPPRPTFPRPSDSITGRYTHPAYPPLTITKLEPSHPVSTLLPAIQRSIQRPLNLDSTDTLYITDYPVEYHSHLLFVPSDGPTFSWVALNRQPEYREGKPTEADYVYVDGCGECVFSEAEGGLGMFGNFWMQGPGTKKRDVTEDDVEKAAEVFFQRE